MGLLKIFSLKSRPMFSLLVVGLSMFSVGSWWSVKSSVEADIRTRLNSEAARVSTAVRDRLDSYATTLVHVRAHFITGGLPSPTGFQSFMQNLDLPERHPGVKAIGYARLAPGPDGKPASSEVVMLEPKDWRTEQMIGADLMNSPERRQAILEAFEHGDVSMSRPLTISTKNTKGPQSGFLLVLPDNHEKKASGVIYGVFTANDFFEGLFGDPSLKNETVNFKIEVAGEQPEGNLLYNRFDLPEKMAKSPFTLVREMELYGRNVRIVFTPLPHFFTFSDNYLPTAVAFGSAFISILILLVLKASQNQLLFETRAKELSLSAAARSRRQTEMLKRINDFARAISLEIDLDSLTDKLFGLVAELARSSGSYLVMLGERHNEPVAWIKRLRGLEADQLLGKMTSLEEHMSIIPNRLFVQKSDRDADTIISQLIRNPERFSDWLLIAIPCREFGRCGFIFLSRDDGSRFDELEAELIESLVAQAASSLDNAKLFRRVESASRAKNTFLANMSHEIRTPLNAIIGFSEIMLKKDVREAQKGQLAQSIRKAGHQLTRIIDDILDLSKIEGGKFRIENRRIRLASVIQDVISIMDIRAREKGIDLTVESSGELPSHIMTDEIRLKQILMNVVANAIKFTEKGSVHVSVRSHQDHSLDRFLAFRVKDTGIGIPAEAQGQLFMPFSQADESHTRKHGGSGLGLALSRRLCRELGGDLMLVESTEGRGSTFEALINAGDVVDSKWIDNLFGEAEPQPTDAVAPAPRLALTGARVLLVEDSPDNQDIFRYFLESAGAAIELADNGLDAVKMAASSEFDLILMDIQIPEIDGKEATRRIRHQGFARPIVALTAHALKEERESCRQAGCDGHITKPVSGDTLVAEVAAFLRRNDGRLSAHS